MSLPSRMICEPGSIVAGGRRHLEQGDAGGGLAAARLADEPEGLALVQVEADVVEGAYRPFRGVVVQLKVLDFQ